MYVISMSQTCRVRDASALLLPPSSSAHGPRPPMKARWTPCGASFWPPRRRSARFSGTSMADEHGALGFHVSICVAMAIHWLSSLFEAKDLTFQGVMDSLKGVEGCSALEHTQALSIARILSGATRSNWCSPIGCTFRWGWARPRACGTPQCRKWRSARGTPRHNPTRASSTECVAGCAETCATSVEFFSVFFPEEMAKSG